jgi:glycosidase
VLDHAGGGGIYRPVTLIPSRLVEDLLRSEFSRKPARESAGWVKSAVIYEVYLRSFSPEGTFAGLEKRIPELKNLGVSVLWLMPIHPVGLERRKGTLGSPYAVRDYYTVNPEFGTMSDFKRLVNEVHRHGMKIIIDLVINHTSWDSRLMLDHPEWFSRNDTGETISPNADWTDVADLDFSHSGLRSYLSDMMQYWVREIGIDGYRCDVAEMVPTDFWDDVRSKLDAIKPVMMLSEGSLPEHHIKAFDITYSWNVYDALDPLMKEKRPVDLLDQLMKIESLQFPAGSLRLRFCTNHDKNAWDAPAIEKFGMEGLRLATVLVNTLPGVPLIYNGEEVANEKRLDLFEKVSVDWSRPREMGSWISRLNELRQTNRSLVDGDFLRLETPDADGVYAFLRNTDSHVVLVILNFSSSKRHTTLTIPTGILRHVQEGKVIRELFGNDKYPLDGKHNSWALELEPRGVRVYHLE